MVRSRYSTSVGGNKRGIETVDLTADDENSVGSRSKFSKPNIPTAGSQTRQPLPTPPLSSQTYGSQSRYSAPNPSQGHYSQTHSQADRNGWLASTQEHDEDIRREINLEGNLDPSHFYISAADFSTEDFDDDAYTSHTLYGILNTKIVGCRYYDGRATTGEYVLVRREPRNPYDSNAIRIDNVVRDQIGHIGRQVAAKLAPLMDSGQLLVEGALTGPKTFYECPIGLKLFGTKDPVAQAALKQQMQDLRLPVNELVRSEKEQQKREQEFQKQQKAREKAAAAMQKNGGAVFDPEGPNKYSNLGMPTGSTEPEINMDQLLSGTAIYNPRDVQDVVNKFVAGEDALSEMPLAEQPAMVATVLLPYQRQGLQWMIEKESPKLPTRDSDDVVQLWKNSHGIYTNIATSFSVTKAPQLASGGILADDMGLGKTLQTISLVVSDPHKSKEPTLILCPLSVMSNWSGQAAHHVKTKHQLRILTYHGQGNKGLTPEQFQDYDLVITTYQTMTQELFPFGKDKQEPVPAKKGLFSIKWRRIVLDEGHNIRNPKAKMAIAASSLMGQSRWILTGNPIVNSLKDLYSHVKFLRMSGGLAEFDIFNGTLIRPLKNNDPNARLLLQALMSTLCLRRMKDMKFIDLRLPEIVFHKMPVKLLSHEQERYDAFKSEAKGLLEAAKSKKGDGSTMTHLLEVLLRLRQTCNHWKLCGEDRVRKVLELVEENRAVDITNAANRSALQDLLQIRMDSQEECPVCMDSMSTPVITACAHAFCRECIEKVIQTQQKCPMCRTELPNNDLLIEPAAGFGESEEELQIDADTTSSKIEALVQVLKASTKDKDVKTVVFSQWTSFLDLVQTQLVKHGLNFTRLDGKMNPTRRDVAIQTLNEDAECKVLLASLSVCSVGLNLVAANQVVLSDSWWAPAIEDQAVDRVHRLGQTRDCKVIRLVVEDTIEDEVLEIQAKKRELAGMAFGEKQGQRSRKEMRAGTLRDIERLLG